MENHASVSSQILLVLLNSGRFITLVSHLSTRGYDLWLFRVYCEEVFTTTDPERQSRNRNEKSRIHHEGTLRLRSGLALREIFRILFLRSLHYYISKFARHAQIFRHRKHLGLGYSSRQGAKAPSSEKNLFLKTLAPLREIFRDSVAA
jgi:hypothetical protein